MAELEIKDAGGDTFKVIDLGKYKCSKYGEAVATIVDIHEELPNFQFRDGDILIASYPKTGCTWTFEIISMLLQAGGEQPVPNKMSAMLEASYSSKLADLPSPRLLNTHIPYGRLPASFFTKKVKVVFVVRNPKDAAVSLYNMMIGMTHYEYKGKFENWLPLYLQGQLVYEPYYKYIQGWEAAYDSNKHDILILHYEDMKEDAVREINKIVEFIGLHLKEETIRSVMNKCQFNVMQNRYNKGTFGNVCYKSESAGFMRKGAVGDWKNWLTVAQSENMDKIFEDSLSSSRIKFRYEL